MSGFTTFIENLLRRRVTPSRFNSQQWKSVEPAIRNRAFFSSTVTSAKLLTKMREYLLDWAQGVTQEVQNPSNGATETVYKANGVAEFKEQMGDFLISEGLATPEDFPDNSISNIAGNARLNLIFSTNAEQAATFADWQMKMSNSAWLNKYPAAEFFRRPGAIIKRQLHVENEGVIKRYDDLEFWLRMNNADIGGFQVPWGPFGFNSYMVQRPVSRAIAEKLGLVRKGEFISPPDVKYLGVDLGKQLNANYSAELDDVTPEIRDKARETIRAKLGPTAIGRDGNVTLDALKKLRDSIGR